MVLQHAILAFSIGAILAPFAYFAGEGARKLKLPQISGYLMSGIICGPYLLGVLSHESIADMSVLESAGLSIIGVAAGAELNLVELFKAKGQVVGLTFAICLFTWNFVFVTLSWLETVYKMVPNPTSSPILQVALSTMGATLMMTRSPASAIAVLKEMDGRGPFCSLVMAVTVFKDVVVIIAYALNMELISAASHPAAQGGGLSLLTLTLPLLSVVLSMATGACGGMLLSYLLAPGNFTRMGAVSGYRLRAALLLGVATVVFQTAYHFDAEPLLACVTMGLALANHGRSPERSPAEREELLGLLGAIMAATNVPFFALLGASIKLPAVANMFGVAVIVFVVRLAAIFSGCWTGCIATGAPPEYRRGFWMSRITQSGVAMGLARVAGARFPDWGPHFQTLMVSIVVCNLTIGPPLFRYSLIQMGEARVGQSKQGPGVALPSPKPLEVKVLLSTEGGEPAEKEDQTPDQRAHSL